MTDRVYCKECENYNGWIDIYGGVHHDCVTNTYLEHTPIKVNLHYGDCRNFNKNNDCKKFCKKLSFKEKLLKLLGL